MAKGVISKTEQKYKIFVAEYLIDENGTRAYKAAYGQDVTDGSAASGATRLLKNAKVIALKDAAIAERLKRLEINADYVLEVVRDTTERCRALQVVTDKKGCPVVVKSEKTADGTNNITYAVCSFDPVGVLKGAELMGKYLKLWTDRLELPSKKIEDMTDQELASLLARMDKIGTDDTKGRVN